MPRPIDADALNVAIEKWFDGVCVYDVSPFEAVNDFQSIVDEQPTVSPDEVRGKGKWIERDDDWYGDYAECSNCHDEYTIPDGGLCFKICPNCGAKMEVKE